MDEDLNVRRFENPLYVPDTPRGLPERRADGPDGTRPTYCQDEVPSEGQEEPEIIDIEDRGSHLKFVAKFKNQIRKYYVHQDPGERSGGGLVQQKRAAEQASEAPSWRCGICRARMIGGDSCVVCLR